MGQMIPLIPSAVDVRTGRYLDGLKLVVEGASIPQCVNGTNLLIPLPGPIDAEDMAITGAGARLHAHNTSTLPFLYEFEEPEGELDFLTRIVAITFYPCCFWKESSDSWRGRDPWSFSSMERKTNPFSSTSLSNDITQSNQKSESANWLDLLTGDDTFSDPLSQPVMQYDVHEGSDNIFSHPLSQQVTPNNLHEENDLLGFLDQAVTEHHCTVADDKLSSQDSSAQNYINCLKLFAGPQMVIVNLRMIMFLLGIVSKHFPNCCVKFQTPLQCLDKLHWKTKFNGSIGLGTVDNNVVDFWNVSGIGDHCSGGMCEVRAEITAPAFAPSAAFFLKLLGILHHLLSGLESLAEFPFASFLHPVETATDSAPFLSLLSPLSSGSRQSYWKAPPNVTSTEFVIVLGTLSDVSGVIFAC
ncbi:hypothetical protein OIU85_004275 [Salix viminalis]|uniref:Uncharacterized protein n=1 Tax=Salix viminalis TaxID=40686 RepID=A0A9Q0PS87_SALVM|nr:hypothetical protein OIU85_004275 [Salix viminalis]